MVSNFNPYEICVTLVFFKTQPLSRRIEFSYASVQQLGYHFAHHNLPFIIIQE